MTASEPSSNFRLPWEVIEHTESYEVRSATGVRMAFVYFDEEPTRRATTHRLTKDEARRLAANIAKLPALLKRDTP